MNVGSFCPALIQMWQPVSHPAAFLINLSFQVWDAVSLVSKKSKVLSWFECSGVASLWVVWISFGFV